MEAVLAELGNVQIASPKDSDVIFLNTCGFLKSARDEVYENLKKLNDKKVIVLGCLVGLMKEDIFEKYPQIAGVVSGTNYHNIKNIFHRVIRGEKVYAVSPEPFSFERLNGKSLLTPRSYAYVKIAEGCDNRCTYCLIPYLKGRFRSRRMEDILEEIKQLISLGIKEIILVSQDCGYYGTDIYGDKKLDVLLQKISEIKGNFWIRVHYVYPERVDEKLLAVMKSSDKTCKYLDMPLQHGDPEILRRMLRYSDPKKIIDKVRNIRGMMPEMTFRTGFIVGFPGETEKQFNTLVSFVKKIKFDHVGVFTYSREKNTPSYSFPNQIPQKTKNLRRKKLMLIQQKISAQKNKSLIGQIQKTLIGNFDRQKKLYVGRSMRFSPEVDGKIFVKSFRPLKLYEFYQVRITNASEYDLFGEMI